MKKYILILILSFIGTLPGFSWQYVSQNYTAKDFHAHPLVWNFTSDAQGRLWLANNDGVLRFDGNNWNLYATPKPVRSMAFDKKGNLFLACEGDMGVFSFDEKGKATYTSLKDKMDAGKEISAGDKRVFEVAGEIYFTSGKHLLKIESAHERFNIRIIELGEITGAFVFKDKLYVNELNNGLGILEGKQLRYVKGGEKLKGKAIIDDALVNNTLLIATNYAGLFQFHNGEIDPLTGLINNFALKGLSGIAATSKGKIALGTFNDGVKIFDSNFNEEKNINLPSNEIYSLFFDHEDNLWISHRRGVTHIDLTLPVKYFSEFDLPGYATDMLIFEKHLFISSSMGLFFTNEERNSLSPLKSLSAECWQLLQSGNDLLVASTNGLYIYKDGLVKNMIPNQTFVHLQKGNISGKIYAFTQQGCYILENKNNGYEIKKVEGLNELANSVDEEKDGSLFIGTYYNGLKKILSKNFNSDALPEELKDGKVIIRQYEGKAMFQAKNKIFTLSGNQFTPNDNLLPLFLNAANKNVDFTGNGWIFKQNNLTQFRNGKTVEDCPAYAISGNPTALCKDGEKVWLAYEDKIYLYEPGAISANKIRSSISRITKGSGEIIFDAVNHSQEYVPKIPFTENNLQIEFGISSFINPEKNVYRYKISGLNDKWSEWQHEAKLNLNGLSSGAYIIALEAKNAQAELSERSELKFEILAPWYMNFYAYLVYGCFAALIILLVIRINGKALIAKNKKLESIVKERTQELEQNNIELQSEREKSDGLLLNVLPSSIAKRLKEGERNIADHYENISICFADIVGFTSLSAKYEPRKIVALLNELYTRFDRLTEKFGVERLKTIGDAYMVIGGAPDLKKDHAKRITLFAIAMLKETENFSKEYHENVKLRIGINSGEAIGAVVGEKKFAFDFWSDAVNIAARMESTGVAGKIHVSEKFKMEAEAQDNKKYSFEDRGEIDVKSIGKVRTYFVEVKN